MEMNQRKTEAVFRIIAFGNISAHRADGGEPSTSLALVMNSNSALGEQGSLNRRKTSDGAVIKGNRRALPQFVLLPLKGECSNLCLDTHA